MYAQFLVAMQLAPKSHDGFTSLAALSELLPHIHSAMLSGYIEGLIDGGKLVYTSNQSQLPSLRTDEADRAFKHNGNLVIAVKLA